jgi:cellobiose phosphorylase
MKEKLWSFTDRRGSFQSDNADKIKPLYFPLCNETLMSSVSPDLHGDIKSGQNFFLLSPVSRQDLIDSRSSRNFWIYINKDKIWSACGASKDLKQIQEDKFKLQAGLLWHKVTRENKRIGLRAEALSFIPSSGEPVEIMQVNLTNITSKKIEIIPTAAIPVYARSANNLRDHRHVTSLLNSISLNKFGVTVKPALLFDESGHKPNKNVYFVLGWDEKCNPAQYLYPTQEMFCGDAGDLEAPESVLQNILPKKENIQGKEAMGALRFRKIALAGGQTHSYIIVMGIAEKEAEINQILNKFKKANAIEEALTKTENFWIEKANQVDVSTGDQTFDNWFRWVNIQPYLRRIFGCSFLPDFDYGKGGRGWRDLWQDCLGLILSGSEQVSDTLINNFSGVRIDGSNATIIGKSAGEFISDRNNISRVWCDHGVWPLLTLDLYMQNTGDFDILFEETAYFCNHQICQAGQVKTSTGKIYKGTILEHLLVQNLVQFFNVGTHNHIRLEGADWNDGLDMARENGESVAFSCMYAHNLRLLSELLQKSAKKEIKITKELNLLLARVNYNDIKAKQKILEKYFAQTKLCVPGQKINIDARKLAADLKRKSEWMREHIQKREWLKQGFFNGYYDNKTMRVEGVKNSTIKMMLQSQVFPIMSGTATQKQVSQIIKSIKKYLLDKKLGGIRLNTDFKEEQHNLGRAFSFAYGEKENGAFFNHMTAMLASALYKRGFAKEGWDVLSSIYNMSVDTQKSKIYPCLPEYFNSEGRGMYSYLTGSASWFVLTLLTEVFGVKGRDGNLLIEPKLCKEQFKAARSISITRNFSGRQFKITFSNPKKLDYGNYKIIKASLNNQNLTFKNHSCVIINRKTINKLSPHKVNLIGILLGNPAKNPR